MNDSAHKIPVREKIGYALGDVATNFFFQSMILYQARFYTDTVGLAPAVVYPIGKDLNLRIQNELEERRKQFAV